MFPNRQFVVGFFCTLLATAGPLWAVESEGHEQPGLLSVDVGSAVWTIVLFFVLLVVLGKFAWPSILKGLQDRESKIRGDLEAAEQAAAKARQMQGEYEQQLSDAHDQVRKLIDQGRADALDIAAQLKQTAQDEIAQIRDRAESDIRSAKQQALTDIYTQTAVLATDVAGRILKRQINSGDQQQLVDEAVNELNRSRN